MDTASQLMRSTAMPLPRITTVIRTACKGGMATRPRKLRKHLPHPIMCIPLPVVDPLTALIKAD
ncbi:hypothetical protein GGTG_06519 [Gaeumannomyces tritici R3-111a-1]|uniref:Uncharacterized protein n=1 Tax=Gaeumannomyces tritici (strain R3-111a-1) TaxID=644352 RepID=J3NZ19_GAET3|nr:hypothetical protein GGTG_06519 [Gaeumannomyces tritici R3-111a-1]EJT76602.1 hypothetical protein GGTG_06519 [Gaeumannomyces tritici R3-111a-1]